jgi:cell division protein ZapA (FtsZ GTPase activity inhibitor)
MNEKVDIEVFRRKLTVEIEGMTPIEINAIAQKVSEKMEDIAHQNTKIADSSKLAILAALDFAIQHSKLQEAQDTQQRALEHKVEELTMLLQSALSAASK